MRHLYIPSPYLLIALDVHLDPRHPLLAARSLHLPFSDLVCRHFVLTCQGEGPVVPVRRQLVLTATCAEV